MYKLTISLVCAILQNKRGHNSKSVLRHKEVTSGGIFHEAFRTKDKCERLIKLLHFFSFVLVLLINFHVFATSATFCKDLEKSK